MPYESKPAGAGKWVCTDCGTAVTTEQVIGAKRSLDPRYVWLGCGKCKKLKLYRQVS